MGELKKQTVSGLKWVFSINISQKIISFLTTLCLARILSPSDFGLFALTFTIINGLGLFKSLGFDSALVQRQKDNEKAADTAFLIIPATGVILFLILFVFAPLAANWLGNKSIVPLVRILGLIFIVNCLAKVPQTLLYKRMQFKEKAIAEISANVVYSVVAILLAFMQKGIWSLVIAYLMKTIVAMSLDWYFAKWIPRFQFDPALARQMFNYGKFIFLGSLLSFLKQNLDNVIIGKILGVAALGYYAIAFGIANISNDYFIHKASNVLFSSFAKVQNQDQSLKKAFLKITKVISIISMPIGIGLVLFAHEFIKIAYGAKWLPAAEALQILAIGGIFKSLAGCVSPLLLAKGKAKIDFYLQALEILIFVVLVVPGTYFFGLRGASIAVVITCLVYVLRGFYRAQNLIKINSLDLLLALRTPIFCSLIMSLFVLVAKKTVFYYSFMINYPILQFVFLAAIGFIAYLYVLLKIDRPLLIEVRSLITA